MPRKYQTGGYSGKKFGGPLEPVNDRMELKQKISDELKRRRGQGTAKDRLEGQLERESRDNAA